MKITIREIAKKANVSVATVSRCINNNGYVHEETKAIIDAIIKEYDYHPNQLARLLHRHCSMILGVIVPDTCSQFMAELINNIEAFALSHGYKTLLCATNNEISKELEYINIFNNYQIDGLIICSNFNSVDKVLQLDIPIVSIDHVLDPSIPSITTDNINGGQMAALKLIESGATNFAIVRGPSFLITTSERTIGFSNVLKEHNYQYQVLDLDLVDPDITLIEDFLRNNPDIDGIFTLSDTLGLITTSILNRMGKKVGKDIFLVSFDGLPISKWSYPILTTVVQPIKYMANEAVNTLLKLFKDNNNYEQHKILKVYLEQGKTTK